LTQRARLGLKYVDARADKRRKAGTVFVSDKLRKELQSYVKSVPPKALTDKLFYSQKRPQEGWNSNTLVPILSSLV
jgi:integrase/recombinase XerD